MKGRKGKSGGQSIHSQSFRDNVARDYIFGDLSYPQVAEKYGLSSPHKVENWVRSYRKRSKIEEIEYAPMTEEDKQDQKALKEQIAKLKKQLADAELRALAYDTMIDVAEEQLGIEIRKKPGTKQSND